MIAGTAGHAKSIMRKIDEGEGSLGGIVNDPEVYEGLKDVIAGIRKSKIGKAAIRHYGKKGAKRRKAEQEGMFEDTEAGDEGEPTDSSDSPEDP